MDLEIDEVAPFRHPLIEQRPVVRLHHLVATLQLVIDPTRDIDQALGRHPAAIAEAAIYRHSVFVLEMLDYHV